MTPLHRILKANPYHDKGGRFSSKEGAGSPSDTPPLNSATSASTPTGGKVFAKSAPNTSTEPHALTPEQVQAELTELLDRGLLLDRRNASEFAAAAWHKHTQGRMSPVSLTRAMLGDDLDNPDNAKKVQLFASPNGKVVFQAPTGFAHGSKVDRLTRRFDLQKNTVTHEVLQLPKGAQGGGVVKKLFKEAIPEYDRIGLTKIELTANIDVGGYAWAKYGFSTRGDSTKELNRYLDGELASYLKRFNGRGGDPDVAEDVEKVWDLLANYEDSPRLVNHVAAMRTPYLDAALGNKTRLGKKVLLGADWEGELDLTNERSRATLKKYLG